MRIIVSLCLLALVGSIFIFGRKETGTKPLKITVIKERKEEKKKLVSPERLKEAFAFIQKKNFDTSLAILIN